MLEIWKDINGYNGRYSISNLGNIRRNNLTFIKSDGKQYTLVEMYMKTHLDKDGYVRVSLKNKMYLIHRLVAEHFLIDSWDSKLQVNHKDGVKLNNYVDNLEIVSCKENIQHAWKLGLTSSKHSHKKVKCLTTGEIYNSVQECIKSIGFSQTHFYRHINKEISSLGGLVYERV